MKIGIIYCAYNCENYIEESLQAFVNLKKQNILSYIAAVSVPFIEYKNIEYNIDNTIEILNNQYNQKNIDILYTEPKFIEEFKARNLCLNFLKENNVDLIWMVDGDELYTEQDIKNILDYIELNPNHYWYKINFKNYIFDGKQWIDDFCPPRIFRTTSETLRIHKFYWDNDIAYKNQNNELISYQMLDFLEIPRSISHVKHMTWLHSNGKSKYEYQMTHFGSCGYKWNYELNKLEFNDNFYLKTGQNKPIIIHE
jgi:glycosyltransferase involved in cell wall biosynthesis